MVNFDYILRYQDYVRIFIKKICTKLGLRDKQSCKFCGRDQKIVWIVNDEIWENLDKKWKNKTLCLECFIELYPFKLKIEDIKILNF